MTDPVTVLRAADVPGYRPAGIPEAPANWLWGADWADVRDLWSLQPGIAHLNHGSFGAVPRPVAEEQRRWQERAESNPVRFHRRELPAAVAAARAQVAAFCRADPDGFAFVPNATTGVSTVLAAVSLQRGDEVLLTDHGYGAVRLALERACHRSGARPVTMPVPLTADDVTVRAAVLAGLSGRTRLAVVDHITSPTARLFPVAELVADLRRAGVPVLVDGAHAPGQLQVDLTALAPDFWVGNFHKWCCSPRGSAGLFVANRWRDRVSPLVTSWGEGRGFPLSFDQSGTSDASAWLATPAALDLLGELGWARLREHNRELAAYGQRVLGAALELDTDHLPQDPVSMRVLPLPAGAGSSPETADALQATIAARLGAETALVAWRDQGMLRVSAQVYNAPEEYDRLAAGLPALLAASGASGLGER